MKELISKIYKDAVISKKTHLANKDEVLFVSQEITKSQACAEKNIEVDEEIDIYVFWKKFLLGVLVSEIKTKSLQYTLYSCTTLDDNGTVDNVHFVFYEGSFLEIGAKNQK